MEYILMLYGRESGWSELTPKQQQEAMAGYQVYTEALHSAGILKGVNRLQGSSTAATVRVVNGKSHVLDGPYVDSKEQLGGYYLIDVPDHDAADAFHAWSVGMHVVGRPVFAPSAKQRAALARVKVPDGVRRRIRLAVGM